MQTNLLKYILNFRGLNEVWTGGLGSYALTLLVVNFFQQHPREKAKDPNENLGTLLLEFFELYGRHFNHEQNGIQVRNEGGWIMDRQTEISGLMVELLSYLKRCHPI